MVKIIWFSFNTKKKQKRLAELKSLILDLQTISTILQLWPETVSYNFIQNFGQEHQIILLLKYFVRILWIKESIILP